MENKEEQISKLTLLLIYLNSWEGKDFNTPVYRAWKGYDFDTLNSGNWKNYFEHFK